MLLLLAIIPAAVALTTLLVRDRRVYEYMTVGGTAVMGLAALSLAAGALNGDVIQSPGGLFYVDALSAYMLTVIALLSFVTAVYSVEYMRYELAEGAIDAKTHRVFYLLYNLFVFTMAVIPMSNNLALLWIAVEGTTLISALLVGTYRKKESIEAAWKYIILCTVGITFALLGTFIIYYASSGVLGEGKGALEWTTLLAMARRLNPATVKLAFILIVVGYGTKAGLAPVHNWLPDAHSEAPTPISALLSGILLNCAFYGVMRFAVITDKTCGHAFVSRILFLFGLASVIVAAVFMLIQKNSKRLLAYSSIEHMGIISLSFGVGGPLGFYAALLHILNHAIGKPLMFFVTGRIKAAYHTVELDEVTGVLKAAPLVGVLGFAGMMALAGAPPFGIFMSEFLMLRGMAQGGHWVIMAVFLAASGFVFYGLLKGFGGMFLGVPPARAAHADQSAPTGGTGHGRFPLSGSVMLGLGSALLLLGIYIPGALDRLITLSAGIVGG